MALEQEQGKVGTNRTFIQNRYYQESESPPDIFLCDHMYVISIPQEQNAIDKVPACVLSFTKNAELAQAFVDFVKSAEGSAIFVKHGFKTIE